MNPKYFDDCETIDETLARLIDVAKWTTNWDEVFNQFAESAEKNKGIHRDKKGNIYHNLQRDNFSDFVTYAQLIRRLLTITNNIVMIGGWIWIEEEVDADVAEILKAAGFNHSPKKEAWYNYGSYRKTNRYEIPQAIFADVESLKDHWGYSPIEPLEITA